MIGCCQSLNAGKNSEVSAVDTTSKSLAAVADSDLRPLVKDTIDLGGPKLVLSVTPYGKRHLMKEGYGEGAFKTYRLEPEDCTHIVVQHGIDINFTMLYDTLLYERIKEYNEGRTCCSKGYLENKQYFRKDVYEDEGANVMIFLATKKNRALAGSILDNVEIIPNPRKATPKEGQEFYWW